MKNTTKPTPSIRTLTPTELRVARGGYNNSSGGDRKPGGQDTHAVASWQWGHGH